MSLVQQIDEDVKAAMKAGESDKLSVLRLLKSALKNKQIELGHELEDAEVLTVIQKEIKQRRESSTEFAKAGRAELAAKEQAEAELLTTYLPAQLGDDELASIVDTAIADLDASGIQDIGKVMAQVNAKVQGQAEGARIASLVRSRLTQ